MDLEQHIRRHWPKIVSPTSTGTGDSHSASTQTSATHEGTLHRIIDQKLHQVGERLFHSERAQTEAGQPVYDENWVGRHATPFAHVLSSIESKE
jgi:hypothetical protein